MNAFSSVTRKWMSRSDLIYDTSMLILFNFPEKIGESLVIVSSSCC